MSKIDTAVKEFAQALRNELKKVETISSIECKITIEGRVEGELKIGFQLEGRYDNYTTVRGGTSAPVILEFMRRHGWNEAHQQLLLTNNGVDA